MKRALLLALCLALVACDEPGDDAAQAACRAYGTNPTTLAQRADLRTTAVEEAQRAAEGDDAFAALPRDLAGAWSRSDAMATAHNSGQEVSGDDLDAYFAADEQVRDDCAEAGEDLGPLKP